MKRILWKVDVESHTKNNLVFNAENHWRIWSEKCNFPAKEVEFPKGRNIMQMSKSHPLVIEFEQNSGFTIRKESNRVLSQGRPALYWKRPEIPGWTMERKCVAEIADNGCRDFVLGFLFSCVRATIYIKKLDGSMWEFGGELVNTSQESIEVARFQYWEGILEEPLDFIATSVMGLSGRKFSANDPLPSVKDYLEKETWGRWGVQWNRMEDPIHMEPNWASSYDTAILIHGWEETGIVLGFTGPGSAFGEIGYGTFRQGEVPLYIGVLLDGILLEPGEKRVLEKFLVISGDWQDSMHSWAQKCADELGARKSYFPLMGYCSWYQSFENVAVSDIKKAVEEFEKWPIPPGGRTIQIDDGFQRMPGDWGPNKRFEKEWNTLPEYITGKSFLPGLWLAPTAVFAQHLIVKEHPECVQWLPDGSSAVSFPNWEWCIENVDSSDSATEEKKADNRTFFLDPDCPESTVLIRNIIMNAVQEGWKYLKLDFTYALSTARNAWNKKKTSFESLRDLYRLFREAAGEEVLLCACVGGNLRYALGYADTARIGADTASSFSSIKNNFPDLILRMCTHGIWWQGDPDVYYMRQENSKLGYEENWLLTGTLGLLGGVFLTSDYPSQWSALSAELVRFFWSTGKDEIPVRIRVLFTPEGCVTALICELQNRKYRLGIYNWGNSDSDIHIRLGDQHIKEGWKCLPSRILPEDATVIIRDGEAISIKQPPHSLRIVCS